MHTNHHFYDPDTSSANAPPHIPSPGTQAFLPALLSHIRHASASHSSILAHNSALPFDSVILQAILLCLVAGDKHLILRTTDDDVANVAKLTALTLSAVFSYPTHKLRIRPPLQKHGSSHSSVTEKAFLRSLFLSPSQGHTSNTPTPFVPGPAGYSSQDDSSMTTQTLRDASSRKHQRHRSTASQQSPKSRSKVLPTRSSVNTSDSPSTAFEQEFRAHGPQLQSTHLAQSFGGPSPPPLGDNSPSKATDDRQNHRPESDVTGRSWPVPPPISGTGFSLPVSPKPVHFHSDPTPIIGSRNLPSANVFVEADTLILPKALVITGLEYTNNLVQRSLIKVLTEKRVVLEPTEEDRDINDDGVWNLPQDFLMVYVCVNDPMERPNVHNTLIDKFAMSTSVTLSPTTRQAIRIHRSSAQNIQALAHSLSSLSPPTGLPIHAPRPIYPTSSVFTQSTTPSTTPNHFRQRDSPILSPTSYPPQDPLLPPTLLPSLRAIYANHTHISPRLHLYTSDLFSAARHHPELEGLLLTAQAHSDAFDLARASRVLGTDFTGAEVIRELDPLPDDSVPSYGLPARSSTAGETLRAEYDGDTTEGGMSDIQSGIGSGIRLLSPLSARSEDTNGHAGVGLPYEHSESDRQSSRYGGNEAPSQPVLDVSEADIMRIVPRIMTHRLRVRSTFEDQVLASAVCPAVLRKTQNRAPVNDDTPAQPHQEYDGTAGQEGLSEGWTRRTVKNILIETLAEV